MIEEPVISNLDKKREDDILLPANFTPHASFVLCSRGSKCTNARGNLRLRALGDAFLQAYSNVKNNNEKRFVTSVQV
jgi:hypothetical protein